MKDIKEVVKMKKMHFLEHWRWLDSMQSPTPSGRGTKPTIIHDIPIVDYTEVVVSFPHRKQRISLLMLLETQSPGQSLRPRCPEVFLQNIPVPNGKQAQSSLPGDLQNLSTPIHPSMAVVSVRKPGNDSITTFSTGHPRSISCPGTGEPQAGQRRDHLAGRFSCSASCAWWRFGP